MGSDYLVEIEEEDHTCNFDTVELSPEAYYWTAVREHADAAARFAGNSGCYEDIRVIDHEEVQR